MLWLLLGVLGVAIGLRARAWFAEEDKIVITPLSIIFILLGTLFGALTLFTVIVVGVIVALDDERVTTWLTDPIRKKEDK